MNISFFSMTAAMILPPIALAAPYNQLIRETHLVDTRARKIEVIVSVFAASLLLMTQSYISRAIGLIAIAFEITYLIAGQERFCIPPSAEYEIRVPLLQIFNSPNLSTRTLADTILTQLNVAIAEVQGCAALVTASAQIGPGRAANEDQPAITRIDNAIAELRSAINSVKAQPQSAPPVNASQQAAIARLEAQLKAANARIAELTPAA